MFPCRASLPTRGSLRDAKWRRRRRPAPAAVLVLCLFLHARRAAADADALTGPPAAGGVALATVIRSGADVLPARVLMRSAKEHSRGLPRVVFSIPGALPAAGARQLAGDGVEVVRLGGGRGGGGGGDDRRLTYTRLLGETRWARLIYLAPETLVREDLAPLAACEVLCAAFLSPCSFATGVMVLTPNATLYRSVLRAWPPPACRGGRGNPDGLDDEACGLNEAFGKELMNAPLFDVGDSGLVAAAGTGAGAAGGQEGTLMRRLPMGCHTPHHLFYPRLRFEVPKENCGVMRVIDFGSLPALYPWLWWTYGIMNLSWEWNHYRELLDDPSPSDSVTRGGVWLRIAACSVAFLAALAMLASSLSSSRSPSSLLCAQDTTAAAGAPENRRHVLPEHVFLVVAVAVGGACWLVSCAAAFSWTPPTLSPLDAFALFAVYKTIAFCSLLLLLGRHFLSTQYLPGELFALAPGGDAAAAAPSGARAVAITFLYTLADVASIAVTVVLVNWAPVGSIYMKLVALIPFCAAYATALAVGLARLSMTWLHWGAAASGDPGSRQTYLPVRKESEVVDEDSSHDD
jgi:hypothetical protein